MTKLQTRFGSAEESPGFLLWKAANLLQRLHGDALADLGITPTQCSLMTCLVYLHDQGAVTAARIIAHSGMDKMMVSDLLRTLERKKLVTRKPNPDDARSTLVAPSARGVRVTNTAVRRIEALDSEFFAAVGSTHALQRALLALVRSPLAAR